MTTPDSPSLLLQRAADKLAELAGSATQGTWIPRSLPDEPGMANVVVESAQTMGGYASLFNSSCCNGNCFGHVNEADDAEWIAAVSPAVAGPLVAWLRDSAESVKEHDEDVVANGRKGEYCPNENQALEFARLTLGDPRKD